MRRFEATELRRFLTVVDQHLTDPAIISLLGGSAMALYGVPGATTDIDACETDLSQIESALEQARKDTGMHIPVSNAAVADAPFNYQDRLQHIHGDWARLDLETLTDRYLNEMRHVIGNRNRLDQNFVVMVHRVFGEIEAEGVEHDLKRHRGETT